ncbi:MAG: flagellar basal body P-ring protein FlgI [Gemmatimonadetes bacterium]|nr:flagellar basal body P-ring protein FlgI [Gemmatimonadota bacterium]
MTRFALLVALLWIPQSALSQTVRVRDLTVAEADIPVRLQGFGLVVGLDGTGDRVIGGFSAGHTVRSVANLLRNFGVEVPENLLRTRNVAAVLVNAEISPYLRPGGRFPIQVASLGDAVSLRGGMLWMTPLIADIGAVAVATAQGMILMSDGSLSPGTSRTVETSGAVPDGGLLEQPLPRPAFESSSTLMLRNPDLTVASLIADAINGSLGPGSGLVADPGAVTITPPDGDLAGAMRQIGDLTVSVPALARVVIDNRDGTVVAGGDVRVGPAVVSHGSLTLSIGGDPAAGGSLGDVRVPFDANVQEVAAALHAVAASPSAIASVLQKLQEAGAITAEVRVR